MSEVGGEGDEDLGRNLQRKTERLEGNSIHRRKEGTDVAESHKKLNGFVCSEGRGESEANRKGGGDGDEGKEERTTRYEVTEWGDEEEAAELHTKKKQGQFVLCGSPPSSAINDTATSE